MDGTESNDVTVLVMVGCSAYTRRFKDVIKPADIWRVTNYRLNYREGLMVMDLPVQNM